MTRPSEQEPCAGVSVYAASEVPTYPHMRRRGPVLLTRSGSRLDYDDLAVAMAGATGKGLSRG